MIWSGATIMFVTGFWDDRFDLKPIVKLLLQFSAATLLVFANYSIVESWPFWISIPLTYFWIIGITNAFNLLDNMDGLSAGTATIIALVFGILALKLGAESVALLAFSLAGAIGGFLILNYNPAKIFMGDSGSLFMGYTMAALPMMFNESLTEFGNFTVLPLVVAVTIVPIFDTSLVTFLRIFKGRSPAQGGADHTSHRLVFAGLTERGAVNTLYLITVLFGGIVLLFYPENAQVFYFLLSGGLVGLLYFALYISRLNVYGNTPVSRFEELIINMPAYMKSRVQMLLIMADIILIIVAFSLAHILRFEQWTYEIENTVILILPIFIFIKVTILALFGVYRSLWRYAGVSDILRLLIAVVLSSFLCGVISVIFFNTTYVPVTVLIIDSLLFLIFISSSRFALKGFKRLINLSNNGKKNVVLYGAGDSGWLALNEIRQNAKLNLRPIGFVDDSQFKLHGNIQGIKVLGSFADLESIFLELKIHELLITTTKLTTERIEQVRILCENHNVSCKLFVTNFNKITTK
jgi:UDP-GlcNAc:undecaprenyl-phosphate GlcNAc-1-phosphate transferase